MAIYITPFNSSKPYSKKIFSEPYLSSGMGPSPGTPMQPNIQYYGAAVTIAQPTNIRTATVYPVAIQAAPSAGAPPGLPVPAQQAAVVRAHRQPHQFNQTQLRYLLAAYRVGMLAMETLARRVHDDRPQAKYARNPPYGEDVKWLLRISKHLGKFCLTLLYFRIFSIYI